MVGLGMVAPSVLWGASSARAEGPQNLVLVKNGLAQCAIVLGTQSTPPERRAADELQLYFKKASGAEVQVVAADNLPANAFPIFLETAGAASAIEKFGIGAKVESLSDEGFILKADKRGLVIASKKPLGVLYGAYTFLENALGVRWLMPGEDGEFVPQKATIAIGEMENLQNPASITRTFVLTATSVAANLKDTWSWMVRNKMQVNTGDKRFWNSEKVAEQMDGLGAVLTGGGHALAMFVPDTLFEAHPEYFSLVNGVRHRSSAGGDEFGRIYQRCTSNPAVIDLSVEYILKFFRDKRAGDAFLIGNNDGNGWCECDNCRALDDPWEAEHGIVSTRFFKFINSVAERVWKEFPNKEIRAWGYQLYQTAPRGVVPDPRLNIFVAMQARCYRHSLDDPTCPANIRTRAILEDWTRLGNTIGVREYYSCFIGGGATMPYIPLEDIVARDLKYANKIGLKLWMDESPPPDGIFAPMYDVREVRESWRARFPMYYVAAKLLWNPHLNVQELEDEAYQKYFGPAGQAMQSYRHLLIKAWEETPGHFNMHTPPITIGKSLLKAGVEKQLLEYLDAADKVVANDAEMAKRVALEREYFAMVWQAMARKLEESTAWNDINAIQREGAISIDGTLSEADWGKTSPTTGFSAPNGEPAKEQTFAQILYDDAAIYFGLTMMEPSPKTLVARYEKRDENLWEDDCVEVFLAPEKTGGQFYHFIINSKGTLYDSNVIGGVEDKSFNANCQVAAKILDDRWVVELRIPYSSLETKVVKGDSWKVNVARSRKRLGKQNEYSSWTDGGFAQPGSFRTVVFGAEPAPLQNGGFENVQELTDEKDKVRFLGKWQSGNEPALIPVDWRLHEAHPGKITIVHDDVHSGKNACQIEQGWIHQMFVASTNEKLHIEFWAKGQNSVQLMLFQYKLSPKGTPINVPTAVLGTVELTDEWTKYEFDPTITTPNVGTVSLSFNAEGTLILDDVLVAKRN
jgi:hypothetical protein